MGKLRVAESGLRIALGVGSKRMSVMDEVTGREHG